MDILLSADRTVRNLLEQHFVNATDEMTEKEFLSVFELIQKEDEEEAEKKRETTDSIDDQNLQVSRYNHVEKGKNGFMIYNTLYNSLARLSDEEYAYLMKGSFLGREQIEALHREGFLIPAGIDERKIYNIYTRLFIKYGKMDYNVTVTPAMECNARCFYCYENGVRHGRMRPEDADAIVSLLVKAGIKDHLMISLFGGEPLMNHAWIDDFVEKLTASGISFTSFMISNGSLIREDMIEKMKEKWKLDCVQITIDGDEEEYLARKNYIDQDENVFLRLLITIKKMAKSGIRCNIRMNIDRKNVDSICDLVEYMEQIFYKENNITFYPAFLTGGPDVPDEKEKVEILVKIFSRLKNPKKMPVDHYLLSLPKSHACYYYNPHAFSVDTSGDVFICEHMLGHHEMAIGNIHGTVQLDRERELSGRRVECQECVFLPKCHGGCHSYLVAGEDPCFIEKYIIQAYLRLL